MTHYFVRQVVLVWMLVELVVPIFGSGAVIDENGVSAIGPFKIV